MQQTYASATVEDPQSGKRYVYARAELFDDRLEVYDKRSGAPLATIVGQQGTPPSHTREWLAYGTAGAQVREHCGGCTSGRATQVQNL